MQNRKKINIEIEGRTPLLMNVFKDGELMDKMKSSIKSEGDLPREEADGRAYKLPDGTLYIPTLAIFAAIMEAGKYHKMGRKQVTTRDTSLIPAGISIEGEACSLGTKDFEVDSRSIVNQNTKGRVMCHRPRLDKWKAQFTLDVDTSVFNEKQIRLFVNDAGTKCGLLSYRPACKGWFGKFDVVKWNVL